MSDKGRRLSHLFSQEMLALAQGDVNRLNEILEQKRIFMRDLEPGQLDKDTATTLWRQNRQILEACRQMVPDLNLYGRPR
jgi:flagellar biosynthesis/type III secretory pathway chaperone